MKKRITILLAFLSLLGITACGNTMPTVDEVLQKAIEAEKSLKSYSLEQEIKRTLIKGQGKSKYEELKIKTDYKKEPFNFYQETTTINNRVNITQKQYVTEGGAYVEVEGRWEKVSNELIDQTKIYIKKQLSLTPIFEKFEMFAKDAKIITEGDDFIIIVDVTGEAANKLERAFMLDSSNPEDTVESEKAREKLNVKKFVLKYRMNKENFRPLESGFEYTTEGEEDGQKVSYLFYNMCTYSKHDDIEQITVPQQILKNAQ